MRTIYILDYIENDRAVAIPANGPFYQKLALALRAMFPGEESQISPMGLQAFSDRLRPELSSTERKKLDLFISYVSDCIED